MKLIEELKTLDIQNPGSWPTLFHILAVAILVVLVVGAGVHFTVIKKKWPVYEREQTNEESLKKDFSKKQRKAVNLEAYRQQKIEIEESFGTMLRQLPGKTEVPSLLVDISQTGLQAGLEEKRFQPVSEIQKGFYAELPIKIQLTGTYHELGKFVSGVAELPRIVTLHDIAIKIPSGKDEDKNDLTLDVTAKTYRYLDEDELIDGEGEAS